VDLFSSLLGKIPTNFPTRIFKQQNFSDENFRSSVPPPIPKKKYRRFVEKTFREILFFANNNNVGSVLRMREKWDFVLRSTFLRFFFRSDDVVVHKTRTFIPNKKLFDCQSSNEPHLHWLNTQVLYSAYNAHESCMLCICVCVCVCVSVCLCGRRHVYATG